MLTAAGEAEPLHGRKRGRAFLDFSFGKDSSEAHRVVLELADDLTPLSCANFLSLCKSSYAGCDVFHVRKSFMIMAGSSDGSSRGNGSKYIVDENFIARHSVPGVVTLPNAGVHKNGRIFAITTVAAPHLDGRNVAIGRVLTGMDVVSRIAAAFAINLKPATAIVIRAAGALPESEWAAVDKALAAEEKAKAKPAAAAAKPAAAAAKPTAAAAKPAKQPAATA